MHWQYGKSVTRNTVFVDPWLRWHDRSLRAPLRYLAWFINAFAFVRYKKTLVLTEGLHITVVIAKWLTFGRLKLICLVDDESPYFIHAKFYKGPSLKVNILAYRNYDGFICIGEMETSLIHSIVDGENKMVYTSFNGVSSARLEAFRNIKPDLLGKELVCIANGPGSWRAWYKGIDLILRVIEILSNEDQSIKIKIIGDWDDAFIAEMKRKHGSLIGKNVLFLGHQTNFAAILATCSLYVHFARGEAWGISVLEAMSAGLPALVSEWTGSKECVSQVSDQLIVDLDEIRIIKKIRWYLSLPIEEKIKLSNQSRAIAQKYPEEKAVRNFVELFEKMARSLGT